MSASIGLALVGFLVAAAPDAGTYPFYLERPVTAADLEGRTLRELSLMRNVVFARAGQPFRKKWVNDYFSQFSWYVPEMLDESKLTALDKANAAFIAKYEIAIPTAELMARRDALEKKLLEPKKKPAKDDLLEMLLLSEAVGIPPTKLMAALKGAIPGWDRNPLLMPKVLDELLTFEQTSDLSRRDLRILRNTIFARHGRAFTTDTMRDYFAKKAWYTPDPKYTDKSLTKIDRLNIKSERSRIGFEPSD